MPTVGTGEPDVLPFLRFRVDGVQAFEPGFSPSNIIQAGTNFTLRTELGFDGGWVGLLTGDPFSIFHHITNLETNTNQTVPGGNFVVPAPGPASHIAVDSAPINLPIPAGFTAGTYRVLTHVHADNAAIVPLVAGFHDGLILMIV
jgi:hypothetical protein